MAYDERLASRIRRVLSTRRDIAERKMFGGLAFLRGGRMCCGVLGQDLVVRLVDEEMAAALRRAHVRPMDFTGRPMRGFIYVSPAGLRTNDALQAWIGKGLTFTKEPVPQKIRRRV